MKVESWKVSKVKVGDSRPRKDFGDLDALVDSIKQFGVLQPVGVDADGWLIFGERRLRAIKLAGLMRVPVRIMEGIEDELDYLRIERDENTCRKEMTPSEIGEIASRLLPAAKAAAAQRRADTQAKPGNNGKAPTGPVTVTTPVFPEENESPGRSRDEVGKALGVHGQTAEAAAAVVDAAKADPEKFGDLPAKMDAEGVKPAAAELAKRKAAVEPAPVDKAGLVIPEKLRDTFGETLALVREAEGHFRALAAIVTRIAKQPGGAWYRLEVTCKDDGDRFECEQLRAARLKFLGNAPYCSACPYCEHAHPGKVDKACVSCKGVGWGPKSLWARAGELEQQATKATRGPKV